MHHFSNNQVNFYTVNENNNGQRLDNLLIKLLAGMPKSHIYKMIRSGELRVNKKRTQASYKLNLDDIIRIPPVNLPIKNPAVTKFIPEIKLKILFEDEYLIIIDKPEGRACHGGSGISFGIIEQLRKTLPGQPFLELVHRLDRDTSGVLIIAKKRLVLTKLQDMLRNREIKKIYLAITNGYWQNKLENVKAPLLKYLVNDERRVKVDFATGKYAHSVFKVLKQFDKYALVEADIKTGRTHQIRVHLQSLAHSIVGDDKYGDSNINKNFAKYGIKRMFLHASSIKFIHPITGQNLLIQAKTPQDFTKIIEQLNIKE